MNPFQKKIEEFDEKFEGIESIKGENGITHTQIDHSHDIFPQLKVYEKVRIFLLSSLKETREEAIREAIEVLPKETKAHTYASENADVYRAFDGGQEDYKRRTKVALESLLNK